MSEAVTPERPPLARRRPSGEPAPLPKELNRAAVAWLIAFAVWVSIWAWVFLSDAPGIWITARDLEWMGPIVDNRVSGLTPTMQRLNDTVLPWTTLGLGWLVILGGAFARRIRHIVIFIGSMSLVAGVTTVVAHEIQRPRPLGVDIIGEWEGFAQPSRPMALLATTLVSAALALVPAGRGRALTYAGAGLTLAACGYAQLYVGVDHPTDVFAGTTVGIAIPLAAFRTAAPESVFPIRYGTGNTAHLDISGIRGDAIRRGLAEQLGVEVTSLEHVGLASSAGSTPLHVSQRNGPDLFAKLYARSHLRSDRSYKLFRTLRYGRLEDEQRYTGVRRLVQHEHYMLHVMRDAGVATMRPIGIVELTPDREYLLASEFLDGAVEISQAEVTVDLVDQGLEAVRRLWDAGLAHRDIKPANVMVHEGRLHLVDAAFGQVRPSPWRQAVDLANMMLVLALGSNAELVYERARRQFSEAEIAEAMAACRGVTLPSALRSEIRRDGRDLLEQLRALAPAHDPVAIQRWSVRRIALTAWVGLLTAGLAVVFLGSLTEIGLWR